MKSEIRVNIRQIMKKWDKPKIMDIEAMSFEFPWTEEIDQCLEQCFVAEYGDLIVGYMFYELHPHLRILNFAVDPLYRRCGVGSQMLAKFLDKLSLERCQIVLEVRERNLPAQLFFRENGFRVVSILRNYYDKTPEDAYVMMLSEVDCDPKNRIANELFPLRP